MAGKIKTKIFEMFLKLSLQQKFIALYIFIIMIPVVAFTLIYTRQVDESAIKDITTKNEYLLEVEKVHIENNIESMRRTAQMVVSDNEFIDFVKSRDETNVDELLNFKMNAFSNVSRLQVNNPTIENIHLYTNNPFVNEMWPILFSEERIADKPWKQEAIDRNGMEMWWYEQQDYDILGRYPYRANAKISVLRELDYPKDEHLGIIEISMLQKNFFPKMFSTVDAGDSAMMVIDQNSNYIVNPENRFLKENEIRIDTLTSHFEKEKKKESFSFYYEDHGLPILAGAVYIEAIDSYMLSLVSLETIFADTENTRNLVLGGIVFLVLILSFLTYKMISYLLKEMYRLMSTMKKAEAGDFGVKVEVDEYSEIGQLAYHFRSMLAKINRLIAEAIHKNAVTKEAELKALKTQIDSHFLFNTLENIKMMAEIKGDYETSDAVTSLGSMMRYNLKWKNDFVLLQEELTHIKHYIEIMNLRLDNRLTLKIDVPDHLLASEVLKMSLQPIVENSVKHGLIPLLAEKQGVIKLSAERTDSGILIEIEDNGTGMNDREKERLSEKITAGQHSETLHGSGIGLVNVNERLLLHYGTDHGLQIESEEGAFTKVSFLVPDLQTKGDLQHVQSVNSG